jgi:glycosyltransferase involved in cell wall biosynthesis
MLQAVDIPADLEPASRSELGLDAAATIFLFMFDMQSFIERKNPQAVIAAFRSAFPDGHEMARLVIKIQNGAHDPASLAALRASASDPRIEFRDATLERTEVLRLISCADAFVSLHRAEGFGRGPAEAMALGKPVILTDYSGTRDFADADNALLVPCTLVPIRPDQYVGVEGQSWAEPDIEAAAAHMRWVHQHREQAARLGERAKDSLQALTPEAIGPKLQDALGLGQAGRVVDFPDAQTRRVPSKRRKTAASA